jgi:hemoglobin
VSIYDALGGEPGIRGVVDDLATRLASDPLLGPLFEGVDHEALQRHRASYLAAVLGGPEQYSGLSMRDAHRPFQLTDEHMERFLQLAAEALDAAEVAPEAARAMIDLLDKLRPVIVDPQAGGEVNRPSSGP